MRDYGRIYSTFWTSPDIRGLSDDGKLLAAYLLSGPHGTIAGVFRLPPGYVAEDLNWTTGRVATGLAELFAKQFINRCETTNWVLIHRFLDWNRPENPNQWKAARKVADSIPAACTWRPMFLVLFEQAADPNGPVHVNGHSTVRQGLPTQEQKQEQKQKQKFLDSACANGRSPAESGTESAPSDSSLNPSKEAVAKAMSERSDILPEDLLFNWLAWGSKRRRTIRKIDATFLTWASKHEPSDSQRARAIAASRAPSRSGLKSAAQLLGGARK